MNSFSVFAGTDGMHVEEHRRAADHRDRREILERVVGRLLAQRHRGGHRAVGGEHERVAVGGHARHLLGGDRAVGAGPVLDDRPAGPSARRAPAPMMRVVGSAEPPGGKPTMRQNRLSTDADCAGAESTRPAANQPIEDALFDVRSFPPYHRMSGNLRLGAAGDRCPAIGAGRRRSPGSARDSSGAFPAR